MQEACHWGGPEWPCCRPMFQVQGQQTAGQYQYHHFSVVWYCWYLLARGTTVPFGTFWNLGTESLGGSYDGLFKPARARGRDAVEGGLVRGASVDQQGFPGTVERRAADLLFVRQALPFGRLEAVGFRGL